MTIQFYKYQGTGNDFIIIDNRDLFFPKKKELITRICNRKFGIGSDGLILLENHPELDFEMVFYNPDASQSFCGNGSRCVIAYAKELGLIENTANFFAIDGNHSAEIIGENVRIKMNDVSQIEENPNHYFLNTGSPHYVTFVDDVHSVNVVEEARKIRYNERFKVEGTNVNFVQQQNGYVEARTYERGVENETLSCGTGMTAVALCAATEGLTGDFCEVKTQGGSTIVYFNKMGRDFTNIWLEGPTALVFKGEFNV
ncbi:MAG: diaminopimelate epimerase [Flavobacteriales bacterium]|nr:MAG: diaminopimelate epimerase [Flavobacteriales bacterium]